MDQKYFNRISKAKRERIHRAIVEEVVDKQGYLQQGFGAQTVADRHGLCKQDISAVTSMFFGGSFSVLLQRLRVSKACAMLSIKANEEVALDKIGFKCGFSNRQSFYNAFHSQKGMTPNEYRIMVRTQQEQEENED